MYFFSPFSEDSEEEEVDEEDLEGPIGRTLIEASIGPGHINY